MRYDHLLDPISDDAPCGPDLESEGDDAFIDYYYEAMARVPERFVNTTTGEIFDRKTLDLKGEVANIEALLTRTVDIRLLVLEAKFQALSGRLQGFAECIDIIARLLKERWHDVHPQVEGGSVTERKNQLELLDDRSSVVMPLEYATLIRDRRLDDITWRDYQLATGVRSPREDERPGDAGSIQAAMRSAENAEAVAKTHELLLTVQNGLKSISSTCRTADSGSFAPMFGSLEELIGELESFVGGARPDLSDEGDAGAGGDDVAAEPGAEGAALVGPAAAATPAPGSVASHAAASAALLAAEAYFARSEPSTPGMLLIRQARKLIGRPLTEALDMLMPSVADYAVIDFGSADGFKMDITKLRELAYDTGEVDALAAPEPEVPEYSAATRAEALALIGAVEAYFRQTEPSSPVPVLLFKAKSYTNRDFSAIISELFPQNG